MTVTLAVTVIFAVLFNFQSLGMKPHVGVLPS